MYLQHFGLEYPPFTRQPNPDVFFAQAGRKNILKELRHDLQQGHAAMLLTGPTGAGKTVLCRLIRHRLDGSTCKVVYLENPVGSFDELLRQVCLQLGMPASEVEEQDITAVFQSLLLAQKGKGRRLLLLIDEAEKMFLAALERLFRLLHGANEEYGVLVLLTGQPALNTSIEQLSGYCEDIRIASTYALGPFSVKETAAYLAYRLGVAGDERGTRAPIFSGAAVQEIVRLGKGVPGIMDGIAEAALENAAAGDADTVLPVHVVLPEDPVAPLTGDDEGSRGRRRGLLLLLLLCLLFFFFFGRTSFFPGQEEAPKEGGQKVFHVAPEETEISIAVPEEEEPLPFVEEETASGNFAERPSVPPQDNEERSLFPLPVPQRPDFKKKEDGEKKENLRLAPLTSEQQGKTESVVSSGEQDAPVRMSTPVLAGEEERVPVSGEAAENTGTDEQNTVVEHVEHVEPQVEDEAEEVPEETMPVLFSEERKQAVPAPSSREASAESLTTAKKLPVIQPASIIELTPGMKKTKPSAADDLAPGSEQERQETSIAPPERKTLVSVASARGVTPTSVSAPAAKEAEAIQVPKLEITPVRTLSRSAKADQLFARYFGAGKQWTREGNGDKFTVQLLVLSSDAAAETIKDMIVREEYQEHSGRLYILRRDTLPPTLFVCYGMYSSMDEARNARNAMPLFLRKHHPYALSISDVLAKARD